MKRKFVLAIALVLLALCLCACASSAPKGPQLIMLGDSRYAEDSEEIATVLTEEQMPLLDSFPNLRSLDLSGSTC